MTKQEIEIGIKRAFEETRKISGAPYDEEFFMDYLVSPKCSKNDIKNSFIGVKRYYALMAKLEELFEICFTLSDLDRQYSIGQLINKVERRITNRRGNKMIIRRRLDEGEKYYFELVTLVIVIIMIYKWGISLLTIILSSFLLFSIYWIGSSKLRSQKHNRKMAEILLKDE